MQKIKLIDFFSTRKSYTSLEDLGKYHMGNVYHIFAHWILPHNIIIPYKPKFYSVSVWIPNYFKPYPLPIEDSM